VILTFPWRAVSQVDPTRGYLALLGRVRLNTVRMLPLFVRYGLRIDHQLRSTPGVVGYRIAAETFGLTYYHLSAWVDSAALNDFVNTAPHLRAMEELAGRLGPTTFRYWTVNGHDVPMHFRREWHRWE
jgi:hypothetical protein